jgi:putative hydrolase of the HAD superfamily
MLEQQTQVLPGVVETLETLKHDYHLLVITKGDILDQERKLSLSGLQDYFMAYDVVSDKKDDTYKQILSRYSIEPSQFVMVGNSLRSDILPVVKLGGHGVYIPHHFTWEHEVINDVNPHQDGFIQIEKMQELPEVIQQINNQ